MTSGHPGHRRKRRKRARDLLFLTSARVFSRANSTPGVMCAAEIVTSPLRRRQAADSNSVSIQSFTSASMTRCTRSAPPLLKTLCGIRQAQIPCAPGRHDDARSVEIELDIIIGDHRDVNARCSILDAQVMIRVLLDARSGRQSHQAHRSKRTAERRQDLAEICAGCEHRRVLEGRRCRVGINHHHRMSGSGLSPQRDHAPAAVIILFDEMIDPFGGRQAAQVAGQEIGIEAQRQSQAIGEWLGHAHMLARLSQCVAGPSRRARAILSASATRSKNAR